MSLSGDHVSLLTDSIIQLQLGTGVQNSFIDTLFRPFQGLQLPVLYDSYATVIDLIIYLILFVGLAKATIGKRFETAGVPVAIGIALAIGLTLSERTLGFSLRTLGPLAARTAHKSEQDSDSNNMLATMVSGTA